MKQMLKNDAKKNKEIDDSHKIVFCIFDQNKTKSYKTAEKMLK